MRKTLIIALREYRAAVQTKAFLLSVIMLPVMMGGSFGVQLLLKDKVDTRPKHYAVLDRTADGGVFRSLEDAARKRNETQTRDERGVATKPEYVLERVEPRGDTAEALAELRLEQSERARRGELAGLIEIGADVDEPISELEALADDEGGAKGKSPDERLAIRFQAHSHTAFEFTGWLRQTVGVAVQERRARQKNVSVEDVKTILRPVPLLAKGLSTRDPRTGEIRDGDEASRLASFLIPAGLVMLMFMMIFVGATPLLQGVVEEKSQRIAEVLLGSVRPFPLMMGKLLGTLGVATTLGLIYLGGAYAGASHYGMTEHLSPRLIAWFLVYQTLGVFLFGSLFISVGAACTSAQETQTLLMPVMLLAMMPLFVMTNVVRDPDGSMATWVSLIPPATPMLMVARLSASTEMPWWQPALGVVLVLLTATACVWAAGRIFRVGLLMQGKGAGFRDMARWVLRG